MAKKSKITKYERQAALVEQYAALRTELKAQGNYEALRKLPLDSHPNRLRHRDQVDGRPRGYLRKFGLSRVNFRRLAHLGQLPGVHKASW